jgi:branched-chain amino acid aminotransferase
MGGMNLYFVFADGRLVTPALTGSLLAGVTRDSILALGKDLGLQVEERLVSTDEWEAGCADGTISEVFACGTAAVVTPVGQVKHAGGAFAVADGEPGPLTMKVRESLLGIQQGTAPDPHGWMQRII